MKIDHYKEPLINSEVFLCKKNLFVIFFLM